LQAHGLLARRYPQANCFIVESSSDKAKQALSTIAKPWWHANQWGKPKTRLDVPAPGSVEMLWANMALHMVPDPQSLLRQWHQALASQGFLMFSCLGPDSLQELRRIFLTRGWPAPCHNFTDMHDWGDMLVQIGFAEPVMDMERISLTFETPQRLLQELRGLGRNLQPQRFTGLRGRQWLEQLQQALAQQPLQLTFEVIYGHALKPATRLSVQPQTVFSLEQMREKLKQGKI
jgi:malonyl-CoA O-methyltransferase